MTLKEDYYIKAGDRCIKFLGEDDVEYVLEPGLDPRVGTPIVVHPTTGEIVTHGHETIKEGDQVIIVPLDNGDQAALKPAWSQEANCKPIVKWVHDVSPDVYPEGHRYEGEREFYAYDIHLSETFYRPDHDMNLTMYFNIIDNEMEYGYLNNRFPYGAVYMAFGYYDWVGIAYGEGDVGPNTEVTWQWCTVSGYAYAPVRGNPLLDLDEEDSGVVWNRPRLCYMDALTDNVCNGNGRCGSPIDPVTPAPKGEPVNYIHIQISCQGSLYFTGYTRSRLQAIDVCRQVPNDCTTRCYGGRNTYPPIAPHDPLDDPEAWEEALEEWP